MLRTAVLSFFALAAAPAAGVAALDGDQRPVQMRSFVKRVRAILRSAKGAATRRKGASVGRLSAGPGEGANSSTQLGYIRIRNELGTRVKIDLEFPVDQVKYMWGVCEPGAIFEREVVEGVAMNVGVTVIPDGVDASKVPQVSPEGEFAKAALFWGVHVSKVATLGSSTGVEDGLQAALQVFASTVVGKLVTDAASKGQAEVEAAVRQAPPSAVEAAVREVPPSLWPFKYFREILPSPNEDAVTKLQWKDKAEGMVLTGANQQCAGDEEIFWGCCYRRCGAMTGANYPHRCGFNMCGKNSKCNSLEIVTRGLICDGFAVGFSKPAEEGKGCCRWPSSEKFGGDPKPDKE